MPGQARGPQWPRAGQLTSRSNQQHNSLGRKSLFAPQKPEPLGRGGLHVDLLLGNLEQLRYSTVISALLTRSLRISSMFITDRTKLLLSAPFH